MFHTYQLLRLVQAILAGVGVFVSGYNARDAFLDRRWLRERNLNGLRELTASSMIFHEASRTAMQVILLAIGLLGVFSDVDSEPWHRVNWFVSGQFETVLDTLVVLVVLAISLHTRKMRTAIQTYESNNDGTEHRKSH